MFASRRLFSGLAATLMASTLAACGIAEPLTGAKEVFLGRPARSPDLPENPKLYIPPANAPLPVPGQGTNRRWPAADAADSAPKKDDSGWFSGIFGPGSAKQAQ